MISDTYLYIYFSFRKDQNSDYLEDSDTIETESASL